MTLPVGNWERKRNSDVIAYDMPAMRPTPPAHSQERGQPCPRRLLFEAARPLTGPSAFHACGFTLIELIVVMALLAIVLAVAAPSLARFFRGRTLDSEAKRFLALTRYGQSRAVSEGVPMVLWIDAKQGAYGLTAERTYTEQDSKAVEFRLDSNLQVEVEMPPTAVTRFSQWNRLTQVAGDVPTIRFTPDGFISETSPSRVLIREGDDGALWIAQSRNRLNYEIQTDHSPSLSR